MLESRGRITSPPVFLWRSGIPLHKREQWQDARATRSEERHRGRSRQATDLWLITRVADSSGFILPRRLAARFAAATWAALADCGGLRPLSCILCCCTGEAGAARRG